MEFKVTYLASDNNFHASRMFSENEQLTQGKVLTSHLTQISAGPPVPQEKAGLSQVPLHRLHHLTPP